MSAPENIVVTALQQWAERFDVRLAGLLDRIPEAPPELVESMRYSVLAPGKRLRPFLVERCFCAAGGSPGGVDGLCAAVEFLHAFTLIHDDLPCMDDAEQRRGQLSNHRVFGEALAILCGDALLAYGLELAADSTSDAARNMAIVRELARAIGGQGVMGGQVSDLLGESRALDPDLIRSIHERKTARLFQACCRAGALAAAADVTTFNKLSDYGLHLGLAFQIADDLLDVLESVDAQGHPVRSDAGAAKQTYPGAVGLQRSRQLGEQAVRRAVASLDGLAGGPADELRHVAHFVMARRA